MTIQSNFINFESLLTVSPNNRFNAHMTKVHQDEQPSKKKGPQLCTICNKYFVEITSHIKIVHEKKRPFSCEICHQTFGKRSGLTRHIEVVHEKKRPFSCDVCSKSFGENAGLQRHRKIHSFLDESGKDSSDRHFNSKANLPNYCHICKSLEDDIKTHYEKKHSDMKFSCKICHRRFKKVQSHDRHHRNVHGSVQRYICDLCPSRNVFKGKYSIKNHMNKHLRRQVQPEYSEHEDLVAYSPEKVIKLENENQKGKNVIVRIVEVKNEDYEYETNQNENTTEILVEIVKNEKEEMISDVEEMEETLYESPPENNQKEVKKSVNKKVKIPCPMCRQVFSYESSMMRHVKVIHNKTFDFPCQSCDEKFFTKIQLNKHMNTKHDHADDESKTKCKVCDMNFSTSRSLRTHMMENHTESKFECEICHLSFNLEDSRNRHMKAKHKEYHCDGCNQNFISTERLQDHVIDEHEDIVDENNENGILINDEFIDKRTCKECNTFFTSINSLVSHIHDHEKTKFECKTCSKSFSFESSRNRHEKVAHDKRLDHRCDACDHREFGTKSELREHVFRYHTDYDSKKTKVSNIVITKEDVDKRKCNYCGKHFAKVQFLKLHVAAVHESVSYDCEFCSKSFSFESSKLRHVKAVHQNIRDFKCKQCKDRNFATSDQLKEHIMRYHTENPEFYQCQQCDSNFISKKVLNGHIRNVHEKTGLKYSSSSNRNCKCKYCGEIIETRYHLDKHKLFVHEKGKKPMRTCQICSLDFQMFVDYESHMKSHENPICMDCGIDFASEDDLKFHNDTLHSRNFSDEVKKFQCDICGHKIFTKSQTIVHMRKHTGEHPYVCETCGKGFQFASAFKYHQMMHLKIKKYACSYCKKSFYTKPELVVHERIHTNEKPFQCEVCDRAFRSRSNLILHLQTHESTKRYFNCTTCNLAFDKTQTLKAHNIEYHRELFPFECFDCGDCFKVEFYYKRHLKVKHGKNIDFRDDDENDEEQEIEYLNEFRNYI